MSQCTFFDVLKITCINYTRSNWCLYFLQTGNCIMSRKDGRDCWSTGCRRISQPFSMGEIICTSEGQELRRNYFYGLSRRLRKKILTIKKYYSDNILQCFIFTSVHWWKCASGGDCSHSRVSNGILLRTTQRFKSSVWKYTIYASKGITIGIYL